MAKDICKASFLAHSLYVLNINVSSFPSPTLIVIFLLGAMFHKTTKFLIISQVAKTLCLFLLVCFGVSGGGHKPLIMKSF